MVSVPKKTSAHITLQSNCSNIARFNLLRLRGNLSAIGSGGTAKLISALDRPAIAKRPAFYDLPARCPCRQSSMALRMASGARLLHSILYSGMPPREAATLCFVISYACSMDLPRTISVATDEQAMATAQPMHLNRASAMTPSSMRKVIKTVSLSTGLLTIALPDGFSMVPAFRGFS